MLNIAQIGMHSKANSLQMQSMSIPPTLDMKTWEGEARTTTLELKPPRDLAVRNKVLRDRHPNQVRTAIR